MTLTVRSATVTGATTKGSALTHAELDENFNHLSQSSNHTFTPSGSGAVSRTVQSKAREIVSVTDFGATLDGTTDDTSAVQAAIDSLPAGGGNLFFPKGRCKGNWTITEANIHFFGEALYPDANLSTQLIASNTSNPILAIGDGTTQCKGFTLDGIALEGQAGTAATGLQINGADRCVYRNFSAQGFSGSAVKITASGTQATTFQYFDGFSIGARNAAGCIGLEVEYSTSGATALFFSNGVISSQASSDWAVKLTRSNLRWSNIWVQVGGTGKGISLNSSGGVTPYIECSNVAIDSDSSSDVLINVDANNRVASWIYGTVTIDGLMGMPGGNTSALSGKVLDGHNAYLSAPFVTGNMRFTYGANNWQLNDSSDTKVQIYRFNNNLLLDTASNSGTGDIEASPGSNTQIQRNGTSAQTRHHYATFTSSSNYHRSAITAAKSTLSNVSGATVTATNLIPDGAFLLGVTTRINTELGATNGTTGYAVGTAADPNLWGDVAAITAGTASKSTDFTATGASGLYIAAESVIITAAGGNFDGTGDIEVVAHYMTTEAD
jgi:hypothetical protein